MKSGFGYVYLLIKDEDIIYIGATRNPEYRIRCHGNKDFDFYVLIFSPNYMKLESELIIEYRAKLNKKGNPDFDTKVHGRKRIKIKSDGEIFALRLPLALHQALKKKTVSSRRSLHGEILFRLEESMKA